MGGVTLGLTFGWSGVGGGGVGVGVHGGEDVSLTQLTAAHHNTNQHCRHRLIPITSVRLQSSQRLPLPQLPHSRPSIKVIHKSLMKVLLYSARAALLPHHGAKLVSVSSLGPQATGGRWSQFSPSEGVRGVSCAGLQSADAGVRHFSSCCCVVAAMVEVCELLSG